jgi:hypothetical protein
MIIKKERKMSDLERQKKEQKILEKVERYKKQQIEDILEEVERFKREAEKKKLINVTTVTREQLEKKLAKFDSPMIVFQSWGGTVNPGGSLNYNVGIRNPDPVRHIWIFAHVFVGLANIVPDVGAAAAAVDSRFPRLTLPKFSGLKIDPGATETLSFSIPIPTSVQSSNYLGNTFLFRSTWHDVGEYLDRSIFVFEVT